MANVPYQHLGSALATDYFFVREQFGDEQWDHVLRTRRFVGEEVLPAINECAPCAAGVQLPARSRAEPLLVRRRGARPVF
jgi:hypothetical protein